MHRQHNCTLIPSKVETIAFAFTGEDKRLTDPVEMTDAIELSETVVETYTKKFAPTVRYGTRKAVNPADAAREVRQALGLKDKSESAGNRLENDAKKRQAELDALKNGAK